MSPSAHALAFAVASLAFAPIVSAEPPTYRVESLGTALVGTAINESGDAVGRQLNSQQIGRAFVAKRGGAVELLPLPSPWQSSDAYAINNEGLVVGAVSTGTIASIGSRAAAWRPTKKGYAFELLTPYPGDQHSTATGVNDLGDIVGGSGGLGLGLYPRAVAFTPEGGVLLPELSLPAAVNNERVVVAWNTLLDLDTMTSTTVPLPPGNWQGFVATDLSESGGFCGYVSGFSGCSTFPLRHLTGAGWEFVGGCATTTSATAINAQGDVLAYVYNGGNWVSFVGEENLAIGSLIDPSEGDWIVTGGADINDARMILASARRGPAFTVTELVRLVPIVGPDLDGDGRVGGADLAILLAAWGTPTADLDGNDTVDGVDLAIMLAAWTAK